MGGILRFVLDLFVWLDNLVFGLIGTVYELFMRIADATFFNEDIFRQFSTRIYSLLGIFMLFKITFSLINYAINPDDLFEKSKGIQNLIGKIILVLILLMAMPTIFDRSRELQRIILKNSVLENIILGIGSTGEPSAVGNVPGMGESKNTAGQRLSFVLLTAFYHPNSSFVSCSSGMYLANGVDPNCLAELNAYRANGDLIGDYVETAWNFKDISILLDLNLVHATMEPGKGEEKVNIMDYQYIISTLAGIFVIYILIGFCLDVGVRSVKLGFLELIAPIPIISYIDPKSSKDGTFNKWVKTCVSTYLDLFLRLAAIYFAIFIFDNINFLSGSTNQLQNDLMVKVFIILGALLFAKQLPDLLKEFFPGMGKGTFNLGLGKKLGEVPIAGKALGALPTGLAATAGAGLGAFAANALAKEGGFFKKMGSGFAGLSSATMRGLGSNVKGKKPGEVYKSAYGGTTQARENRILVRQQGGTPTGVFGERFRQSLHKQGPADRMEQQSKVMKTVTDAYGNMKAYAEKELEKDASFNVNSFTWTDSSNVTHRGDSGNLAQMKADINAAVQAGNAVAEADARARYGKANATAILDYAQIHKTDKAAVRDNWELIERQFKGSLGEFNKDNAGQISNLNSSSDLKRFQDVIEDANISLQNSKTYNTAQANKNIAKSYGGKK